jgi:hypothetical protein
MKQTINPLNENQNPPEHRMVTRSPSGGFSADAAMVRSIDITRVAGPCAGLSPGSALLWELLPFNPVFLLNDCSGASGMMPKWMGPLNLAMTSGETGLHRFGGNASIGSSANWNGGFKDSHYFCHHRTRQPAWEAGSFIGFQAEISGVKVYGYVETTWDPDTHTYEILSAAYDPSGAEVVTPAAAHEVP